MAANGMSNIPEEKMLTEQNSDVHTDTEISENDRIPIPQDANGQERRNNNNNNNNHLPKQTSLNPAQSTDLNALTVNHEKKEEKYDDVDDNKYNDPNKPAITVTKPKRYKSSRRKSKFLDDATPGGDPTEPGMTDGGQPWMDEKFLEMYQVMRALEKDYKVAIAVPEFLFFGFQSSGKTSTLSVVSGVPAGTMKDGTGTRCPVRYTMSHDAKIKEDIITCQGSRVRNYEDQVQRVCDHMSSLANENRFAADIYEVTITSSKVPNMIFVDMPGMLRNDNEEFREWKRQLEKITCELLGRMSTDGENYAFIPVFVKAAHDPEDEDPVQYIDHLLKQVRPRWKDDALFIVNKFDRSANFEKANQFVEYMDFMDRHGQTVFTSTNPKGAATSRMTAKELTEHIQSVPDQEDDFWEDIFDSFENRNDKDIDSLREAKRDLCGVRLMNGILKQKMIDIVRTTLPYMQTQLDRAQMEKEDEISQLQTELQLGDPSKIKALVERFNVKYLAMIKEFYASRDHGTLGGIRRGWKEEMQEFHQTQHFQSKQAKRFENNSYYIQARELRNIFRTVGRKDLKAQINMRLTATASIKRLLDFWIAMISLMNFPLYNDTDIFNLMRSFDGTIQSDPWETARNLVFRASSHLRDGCIWLAECLKYHFKSNADIVFNHAIRDFEDSGHYTKTDVYRGSGSGVSTGANTDLISADGMNATATVKKTKKRNETDEKMIHLLRIGKEDYDKVIDALIREFIDNCEKIPNDQTECLDKKFVATAMYYSEALNKLWDFATNYRMDHTERIQLNWQGIQGGRPKQVPQSQNSQNNGPASPPMSPDPKNPQYPGNNDPNNPNNQNGQNGGNNNGASYQNTPQNGPAGDRSRDRSNGQNNGRQQQGQNGGQYGQNGQGQNGGGNGGNNDEDYIPDSHAHDALARPAGMRDTYFYRTLYPRRMEFQFPMQYENDVEMIYNLARVQWSAVKQHVISSVQQQFGHRLMKEVTMHGKEQLFNNAMLQGFDRPQIMALIDQLTRQTNIPSARFEEIIDKSPIPATKSVMQMTDQELLAIYGKEIEQKRKRLETLLEEYKDFLDKKYFAEMKIEEIKSIEFQFEDELM